MMINAGGGAVADYRANIYRFLSQVYLAEPAIEFAELLTEGDFRNSLAELGVVFDEVFDTGDPAELRQALKSEYTRLFLGPGHVPPYESVFTDQNAYASGYGQMYGPAAQEVESVYLKYGFTASDEFTGMPDHIGVELSFMGLLAARESVGDQIKFVEKHLANWLPVFCDRAAEFAELHFYKTIIILTKEFVLSDLLFLTSIPSEIPVPAGP